jgi:hypothetical protein
MIGLALAPWNVLAGGKLRTDAEEERRRQTGEHGRTVFNPNWERTDDQKKMSKALEEVAKQVGTEHITAGKCDQARVAGVGLLTHLDIVAIAYVLQKTPYVFPIIGGRKVEHMLSNIEALSISLTPEQIAFIEGVIPFEPGFPHTMIVSLLSTRDHDSKFDFLCNRVMGPLTIVFSHRLHISTSCLYSRLSDPRRSR